MRALALALVAVAAAAGDVAAQPERPLQLDVAVAGRYGGHGRIGELRVFAGYAHHVARSSRRSLFVAAGLAGSLGEIHFDDPRGVDGRLVAPRRTIGPSLRLGYAWSWRHSWPQIYTFAGATAIVADTRTDSRLVLEAGRAGGGRLSLGVALPGSFEAIARASTDDDDDGELLGLLLLVLPNTFELSVEELFAGGDTVRRAGVGLGWAL